MAAQTTTSFNGWAFGFGIILCSVAAVWLTKHFKLGWWPRLVSSCDRALIRTPGCVLYPVAAGWTATMAAFIIAGATLLSESDKLQTDAGPCGPCTSPGSPNGTRGSGCDGGGAGGGSQSGGNPVSFRYPVGSPHCHPEYYNMRRDGTVCLVVGMYLTFTTVLILVLTDGGVCQRLYGRKKVHRGVSDLVAENVLERAARAEEARERAERGEGAGAAAQKPEEWGDNDTTYGRGEGGGSGIGSASVAPTPAAGGGETTQSAVSPLLSPAMSPAPPPLQESPLLPPKDGEDELCAATPTSLSGTGLEEGGTGAEGENGGRRVASPSNVHTESKAGPEEEEGKVRHATLPVVVYHRPPRPAHLERGVALLVCGLVLIVLSFVWPASANPY